MSSTLPKASHDRSSSKNIIFIHPDLGIGGAERLIIDAAVGLQELGHRVVIYTSYCDRAHCFDEARDGTLDVRVRAPFWLPSSLFGRFHILFATLRQLYLLTSISLPPPLGLFSATHRAQGAELAGFQPHVFFVDQLSACLPLLRWTWPEQRALFYCHFPDQLLVQKETRVLVRISKTIYRFIFDALEAWTMRAADTVVVNSKFTREIAYRTFGRAFAGGSPLTGGGVDVIYPCVNTASSTSETSSQDSTQNQQLWPSLNLFLSINRFERKKHISLAIYAFSCLPVSQLSKSRLVIAGGYDPHLPENKSYYDELAALCETCRLSHATARTVPTAFLIPDNIRVVFLLSIPSEFKNALLASAKLLIYTPRNEHFGIVPVEAMHAGLPVLASNTGGPLESIIENETGWLRDAGDQEEWTEVMQKVLEMERTADGRATLAAMRKAGRERASREFSRGAMAKKLDNAISAMVQAPRKEFLEWRDLLLVAGVAGAVMSAMGFYWMRRWVLWWRWWRDYKARAPEYFVEEEDF